MSSSAHLEGKRVIEWIDKGTGSSAKTELVEHSWRSAQVWRWCSGLAAGCSSFVDGAAGLGGAAGLDGGLGTAGLGGVAGLDGGLGAAGCLLGSARLLIEMSATFLFNFSYT